MGAKVVIVGKGFTGTLAVRFNQALAAFRVDSPTQITAVVPHLATDGPISVTSLLGTGTSDAVFHVTRRLSIGDVSLVEGRQLARSTRCSRSGFRARPAATVSVDFATADRTARAGQDYAAASGTLTFPAGTRHQSITSSDPRRHGRRG